MGKEEADRKGLVAERDSAKAGHDALTLRVRTKGAVDGDGDMCVAPGEVAREREERDRERETERQREKDR